MTRLSTYQWLIFTSVNGVRPFMDRLHAAGKDARALANLRLCAIGPRTAQELGIYGLTPDVVPAEFQAEGVIAALAHVGIRGSHVLIPRAEVAREILPEQLRELGATVDVIPVYRTIVPTVDVASLTQQLHDGQVAAVTFTSSSTVRNFVELFGGMDAGETTPRPSGDRLHRTHYGTYGGGVWVDGHGHAGRKYCAGADRSYRETFQGRGSSRPFCAWIRSKQTGRVTD